MSRGGPLIITTMGGRGGELQPFTQGLEKMLEFVEMELEESTKNIRDIAEFTAPYKTGRLQDNHSVERVKRFVYRVVNITPYSIWVHDGTRHMAPRPWLKNAHDDVVAGMLSRIRMRFESPSGGGKITMAEASAMLGSWPPRNELGQFTAYKGKS